MQNDRAFAEAVREEKFDGLPDALLVALYRYFKCCRIAGTDDTAEKVLVVIDRRGLNLDNFNGSTGFGTRND